MNGDGNITGPRFVNVSMEGSLGEGFGYLNNLNNLNTPDNSQITLR